MDTDDIDWIFDTSREGTIPKGGFGRWIVKCWVIKSILFALASLAGVVTVLVGANGYAPEFVFAVTMGAFIFVFCVFLVWMTYRRTRRRNRRHEAEDIALRREIAQYHREKRLQENR